MGCGCKKKNNETTQQPADGQAVTTTQQTEQTQQDQQTQEQVIQVAVALREMIENKEL